ncbi:MAG: hypothetical protein BWK76_13465 [Desulfobulbaceae bacterium A2]|nr:MAG: hypothetical protein BWK76_13465 [Desulfobulbaceae bacterium A2]
MRQFFCSKDCPDLCAMRVETRDGRHRFQGLPERWSDPGFVCGKFKVYAAREIANGLRSWHKTPEGRREFAGDQEAIAALARFLNPLRDKKILYLRGSGSLAYNMGWWDVLFASLPNCWSVAGGPCDATGCDADEADFGVLQNPDITVLEQADTIILYGKNAAATSPHLFVYLKQLQRRGKHILSIDPVRTATSQTADRHIRIRPGCDGLLACALLTELGLEQGHDSQALRERAGVDAEDFHALLAALRRGRTAHIKGFSIQRHDNGMNAYRWINRLAVKTGGMNLLFFGHASKRFWEKPGAVFRQQLPVAQIPQALANGDFDLYVNIAANPAMTYPDCNAWRAGLSRTPTLVVDTCHSATAEQADFFLKVGGMFAQDDFMGSYFFPHQHARKRLTDELSDMEAARLLAAALGIPLTIRDQTQLRRTVPPPARQYRTASLPLLPPPTRPEGSLQLLTASHHAYLNSQILPGMEQGLQVVRLNPADAVPLAIQHGDDLRICGPAGVFVAEALLTNDIVPGTVMCWKNIPMKQGAANNAILNRPTDAGSGLAYYSTFVELHKVSDSD